MKNNRKSSKINDKIYLKTFVNQSPFSKAVLREVSKIPLGQTRSYSWVAKRLKRAKAVHAVGQVLKRNKFPIIIPCHRVIKADGKLGGYSKGIKRKKRLLFLEREIIKILD